MGRDKLRVEEKAEELVAEITLLLRSVRYSSNATIHLEKSVDSVHFNIGEGVALFQARKKAAKYDIARGEAKEVQKALRALVLKQKLQEKDIAKAYDLADAVIAMLTNLIKGLEARS